MTGEANDTFLTTYGALQKASSFERMRQEDISYRDLLRNNREFRLFIFSYTITNCGEWLTYVASIDVIERKLQNSSEESRTAISILVLVRLLPNVFFSIFGGHLADYLDRRKIMVVLDIASAMCGPLFILAYELQSILLLYATTLLQQSLSGMYQPSSQSIVPMLVNDDKELKKGTTLEGLIWSGMQAIGAAASGFIVEFLGSRTCFLFDSATFLASAFLLWLVRGEYNVSESEKESHSVADAIESIKDGAHYLSSSFFASIIFFKASGALAWGACDILNVVLSEEGDAKDSNQKVGILFCLAGIGCLLGPLLTEPFVDVAKPSSLQLSCVLSFAVSAIGYLGWSFPSHFLVISLFALIRSAGSSIIWINSTLLLQKFTSPEMMGRVLATDYALALLAEALSAVYCGVLIDHGLSAYRVSFLLAILGLFFTLGWSVYHISGHGAKKFRHTDSDELSSEHESNTSTLLKKHVP